MPTFEEIQQLRAKRTSLKGKIRRRKDRIDRDRWAIEDMVYHLRIVEIQLESALRIHKEASDG